MTSSCRPFGVGTPKGSVARMVMIMDLLDIHGLKKTEFGLGMRFFGPHGIGPHAVGALQGLGIPPFCPKNEHFWSRNVNYPRFFGLFLDLLGYVLEFLRWTLRKMGARSNLVVGGSLHVIESTSFPSPTGFPDPPDPPGDPPDPPGGVWK